MSKIRVGVLRGGPFQYETSLQEGSHILKNLPENYFPRDIFVDRNGIWHSDGIVITPGELTKKVDVVWNAMHHNSSSDLHPSKTLSFFSIPHTGPSALTESLVRNKSGVNKILKSKGIRTPYFTVLRKEKNQDEMIRELFRTFPMPALIIPLYSETRAGGSLATSFHDLQDAITKNFLVSDSLTIEEGISPRTALCVVTEDFRDQKRYAFLPVHSAETKFSESEKKAMEFLAKKTHEALGLRHYSETHFAVHPKRGVFVVGVRVSPEFTPGSYFHSSLEAVGSSFGTFLDHVLTLALKKD